MDKQMLKTAVKIAGLAKNLRQEIRKAKGPFTKAIGIAENMILAAGKGGLKEVDMRASGLEGFEIPMVASATYFAMRRLARNGALPLDVTPTFGDKPLMLGETQLTQLSLPAARPQQSAPTEATAQA